MPKKHGFLSEILIENGYNTYALGKWHMSPSTTETAAGPYDRWPLGRGFERYYGFLPGETDQWYPDLTYDNHAHTPPATPAEGYHLSKDLADMAIEFVGQPAVLVSKGHPPGQQLDRPSLSKGVRVERRRQRERKTNRPEDICPPKT
jgi:arylsulfatase